MKTLKNKKGFTLVELVVVMVILGILAVILIPRISAVQNGARRTACQANLRILDSVTAIWISDDPKNRTYTGDNGVTIDKLSGTGYIRSSDASCPGGGTYTLNDEGRWVCSLDAHGETGGNQNGPNVPGGGQTNQQGTDNNPQP